jgi:hypothetical protein
MSGKSDLRKILIKNSVGKSQRSHGGTSSSSSSANDKREPGEHLSTSTGGRPRRNSDRPPAIRSTPYERRNNNNAKHLTNIIEISNLSNRNEQEILQFLASKGGDFTPVKVYIYIFIYLEGIFGTHIF